MKNSKGYVKLIAVMLSIIMLVGMMPLTASAEDEEINITRLEMYYESSYKYPYPCTTVLLGDKLNVYVNGYDAKGDPSTVSQDLEWEIINYTGIEIGLTPSLENSFNAAGIDIGYGQFANQQNENENYVHVKTWLRDKPWVFAEMEFTVYDYMVYITPYQLENREIERGSSVQMSFAVFYIGQAPVGFNYSDVTWRLGWVGAGSVITDSYITNEGLFTVGLDEQSQRINVRAIAPIETAADAVAQFVILDGEGNGGGIIDRSSDASLSNLTVSAGTLSPAFDPATTSYTVTVPYSVNSIDIGTTANHAAASVSGTGTKALSVGVNAFYIVVTAEDGTTKTYTVTVTREEDTVGVRMTSELYFNAGDGNFHFDSLSGKIYEEQRDKWHWDAAARILTLNGFTWHAEKYVRDDMMITALTLDSNMTLNIEGVNTITAGGVFWRIYGILFANDSPTRITGDGELNVTVWGPATSTDWSYAFGSNFIVDGPSVNLTAGDIGLASGRIASGSITIVSNRWAVYTAFSVDAPEYTYWTNSLPEHPGGPGNYYPEDPHVVIGLNTRYVRIDCGPRETEPVTLSEIVITSPPDKTVYDEGDALDLTGLVVTAIYSDGSSEIIDDYTTDVPDGEILDSKYVTKEGTWWISVIYEEDDITKLDSFMIELIAHTHVEDAGTITTPATCDVEGVMTFKCVVCGEILRTAAIPALDHDWGAWTVTTPAECETPGVETRVCANDPAHVETRAIAALEHEWDGGVVTIPPTKEAEGVMTYTCKLCGVTRTEPIPKLPSTPVNTDVEFLQGIAADVLRNGLSQSNLILDGKTLTLIIDGREFVLSTNANNRNISGEIALGDGYYLVFDIKGNGVNMKDFKVIQR